MLPASVWKSSPAEIDTLLFELATEVDAFNTNGCNAPAASTASSVTLSTAATFAATVNAPLLLNDTMPPSAWLAMPVTPPAAPITNVLAFAPTSASRMLPVVVLRAAIKRVSISIASVEPIPVADRSTMPAPTDEAMILIAASPASTIPAARLWMSTACVDALVVDRPATVIAPAASISIVPAPESNSAPSTIVIAPVPLRSWSAATVRLPPAVDTSPAAETAMSRSARIAIVAPVELLTAAPSTTLPPVPELCLRPSISRSFVTALTAPSTDTPVESAWIPDVPIKFTANAPNAATWASAAIDRPRLPLLAPVPPPTPCNWKPPAVAFRLSVPPVIAKPTFPAPLDAPPTPSIVTVAMRPATIAVAPDSDTPT